jgi:hypothetical protein
MARQALQRQAGEYIAPQITRTLELTPTNTLRQRIALVGLGVALANILGDRVFQGLQDITEAMMARIMPLIYAYTDDITDIYVEQATEDAINDIPEPVGYDQPQPPQALIDSIQANQNDMPVAPRGQPTQAIQTQVAVRRDNVTLDAPPPGVTTAQRITLNLRNQGIQLPGRDIGADRPTLRLRIPGRAATEEPEMPRGPPTQLGFNGRRDTRGPSLRTASNEPERPPGGITKLEFGKKAKTKIKTEEPRIGKPIFYPINTIPEPIQNAIYNTFDTMIENKIKALFDWDKKKYNQKHLGRFEPGNKIFFNTRDQFLYNY